MFKTSQQRGKLHMNSDLWNLSGICVGYALHAGRGSWKGDILVANVEELQENDIKTKEALVPKEGKQANTMCKWFRKIGRRVSGVRQKSARYRRKKNTAVIFKEKRTNQILQNINETR